jgi:hypothetical protein
MPALDDPLVARLLATARAVTPLAPITAIRAFLPQLDLGDTVDARVASKFSDGTFRVIVGGTALRLTLNPDTPVGQTLTLRLVAREPQLQFEVLSPAARTQPQVSNLGRLINQVLSQTPSAPPPAAKPVVQAPTGDAIALREPLARAVEHSGLFYESHQARWVRGDYPIERLLEEPQAALESRAQFPESAEEAGPLPHTTAPNVRLPARTAPDDTMPEGPVGERRLDTDALPMADKRTTEPAAREALPLVRQQIETLEARQIGWHGEIWPGQSMQWQIEEREPEQARPGPEPDWRTRVALSLPALGDIDAALSLSSTGIRIRVSASDPAATSSMQAGLGELQRALEAAGLNVVSLDVSHRGPSF